MTTAARQATGERSSGGNAPADGNNVMDAPMGNPQRSAPDITSGRTSRDCKEWDGARALFNIQSGPCESRARGEEGVAEMRG